MSEATLNPPAEARRGAPPLPPIISVKKLWKVFHRDPRAIIHSSLAREDKATIQKKTGAVVGLRDVNLEIDRGEFYILMGLSGSGKSTLIRNLIRLIEPSTGSIEVNGTEITRLGGKELLNFRRRTFGMVFQQYGLFPHLTVIENAAYGLKVRGLPPEERYAKAADSLKTVGLEGWEHYYPGNLSGGMQQRVGLARALANDPDILLMDEPFSGLDPLLRRKMQDELVELQDKLNKTIVFVTHDLNEALKLGNRIAIMKDGEIRQIGTPEEIITDPRDEFISDFVRDAIVTKVLTAGRLMGEPEVLLYAWEGIRTSLHLLHSNKRNWSFVVDKAGKLLGVANEDTLNAALDGARTDSKITAQSIIPVPTVHPDTVLENVFTIINANPYPVPVVDDSGKLVGVLRNDTIFRSITPKEG